MMESGSALTEPQKVLTMEGWSTIPKKQKQLVVKCNKGKILVFKALDNIPAGSQLLFDYNDDRTDVINENIWMKNWTLSIV